MSTDCARYSPLAASSGLLSPLLVAGALLAPASAQATSREDLGVIETTGGFEASTGLPAAAMSARGGTIELDSWMVCGPAADGARCDLSLDVWTGSKAWSLDARLRVGFDDDGELVWEIVSLSDPGAFTRDDAHFELLERVVGRQLAIVQDEVYLL